MPCVHGLDHVECLPAAHFADDQTVGAHAQRRPHQVANGHFSSTFGIRRPRFEANHVGVVEAQFGAVFDGDHTMVVVDRPR